MLRNKEIIECSIALKEILPVSEGDKIHWETRVVFSIPFPRMIKQEGKFVKAISVDNTCLNVRAKKIDFRRTRNKTD